MNERFARLIIPKALWIGVGLTFVACSAAGWLASSRNPYRHLVRFHQFVSHETLFQPTVSQLRALAMTKASPGRIVVIVGGSSVMNGVGQSLEHIWTRRLEERLGEPYRVVNLAMRAGLTSEAGALAAESLTRDGVPVIYVADIAAGTALFPLGRFYDYMFWDAYYKGLLIDDPVRGNHVRETLHRADAASRTAQAERRLGAALDSLLRFNDLWTSVGYRRFFTVWNFVTREAPFRRRRGFPDFDPELRSFSDRYPEAGVATIMERVRVFVERRRITFDVNRGVVFGPDSLSWEEIRRSLEMGLPSALRRRTLLVVIRPSSFYVDKLIGEEKLHFDELMRRYPAVVEEAGYEAVAEEDQFTVDDFVDALHLSPSGGAKLADLVAPKIRAIAQRLGYIR